MILEHLVEHLVEQLVSPKRSASCHKAEQHFRVSGTLPEATFCREDAQNQVQVGRVG